MKIGIALRMLRTGLIVAAIAGTTAACSGGGSTSSPPAVKAEDFFGTAFGVDFRAAANSEPAVPVQGDIIPVSLTTEPQELH